VLVGIDNGKNVGAELDTVHDNHDDVNQFVTFGVLGFDNHRFRSTTTFEHTAAQVLITGVDVFHFNK
jgi:hypothetical protein